MGNLGISAEETLKLKMPLRQVHERSGSFQRLLLELRDFLS